MTGFLTAATKKVLSPISETRIIAVDFRNPCTHMHKFIVNYPCTFNLKRAPIFADDETWAHRSAQKIHSCSA